MLDFYGTAQITSSGINNVCVDRMCQPSAQCWDGPRPGDRAFNPEQGEFLSPFCKLTKTQLWLCALV